jgi:hypothetical protein
MKITSCSAHAITSQPSINGACRAAGFFFLETAARNLAVVVALCRTRLRALFAGEIAGTHLGMDRIRRGIGYGAWPSRIMELAGPSVMSSKAAKLMSTKGRTPR